MRWQLGDFEDNPKPVGVYFSCEDYPGSWVYLEPWYDCEDHFDSNQGHARNWKMVFP